MPRLYPPGFPSASDAPESVAFEVALGWDLLERLATRPSLSAVHEEVLALVRETVPAYAAAFACRVARAILAQHLDEAIARHEAPFFSEGIKKELGERGVAVTQSAQLRQSFREHFRGRLNKLVSTLGLQETTRAIATGKALDDSRRGNFAGYSPEIVEQVLAEGIGDWDPNMPR